MVIRIAGDLMVDYSFRMPIVAISTPRRRLCVPENHEADARNPLTLQGGYPALPYRPARILRLPVEGRCWGPRKLV